MCTIGVRNFGYPLKEKKGQLLDYQNLVRMGNILFTTMSLFPEADYTSFPGTWRPDHDKALIEYIRLDNPKTLEEHCIRARSFSSSELCFDASLELQKECYCHGLAKLGKQW